MASREQVLGQIARLNLVFKPREPRIVDGSPNPRSVAYEEIYIEALLPFDIDELEQGIKTALESHKLSSRPTPAELRKYCLDVGRPRRELKAAERRNQLSLPPPEPQFTDEHRKMMADRMSRIWLALKNGHADGTPYGKDYAKDRAWVYDGIPAGQRSAAQ